MIRILVVEDEVAISELIKMNLIKQGYHCITVNDGIAAADILEQRSFDLVLLDIMLPGVNGYELIEYIKPLNIPVIFITAKDSVQDRVKGLGIGAEDYIIKPFAVAELIARIEVVLRRYKKLDTKLKYDEFIVDQEEHVIIKGEQKVELRRREFDLFVCFIRNRGIALYRNAIYEQVWQSEYTGDSRTVDIHIQRLRKKLDLDNRLKTVYKLGYRLE